MKKYQKQNSEEQFEKEFEITSEFKKRNEATIKEVYEQTIVRSFENNVHPIKQLEEDAVDILLWLDICKEKELEDSIKIVKTVWNKINLTIEKMTKEQKEEEVM